ncbi:heavy metal-binding domain-containing protein [Hymenobacter terrenus]|uniref:heavy metal-binding domain-containing protein n=1 Tax=Hymenobacter terrenus TaxID=1629124 RepID=UPI00061995DD|nr:heavy metal-binding domain-containing protein [Hymenobacter terrenus]
MLLKFRLFFLSALGASALCLSGCESEKPAATTAESAPAATTKPGTVPAIEASYECPMGCAGSQSAKPGKCPTCGMELEKKS